MAFNRLALTLTALAAPAALVSCANPSPLYVDQAWIQLNPNAKAPAAAYFVIHGGPKPVKLLDILTEGAVNVEMHDSVMKNGMMTMAPMSAVDVPAKTNVAFTPGGKHLMLFGLNPAVIKAGTLKMIFVFSNGDRLIVDAQIKKGGMARKDMGNMAMPDNTSTHMP